MHSPLLEHVKLRKGSTMLDLGFGQGENLRYGERLGWKVTGLDIDPKNVAKAQSELRGTILELPMQSLNTTEEFNLIIAMNSLQFLKTRKELRMMLNKIYTSLKPGGYFLVSLLGNHDDWNHLVRLSPALFRYTVTAPYKVIEYHEREYDGPSRDSKVIKHWHTLTALLRK